MTDLAGWFAATFNAVATFLADRPALLAWVAFAAVLALVGWWTTPTAPEQPAHNTAGDTT